MLLWAVLGGCHAALRIEQQQPGGPKSSARLYDAALLLSTLENIERRCAPGARALLWACNADQLAGQAALVSFASKNGSDVSGDGGWGGSWGAARLGCMGA